MRMMKYKLCSGTATSRPRERRVRRVAAMAAVSAAAVAVGIGPVPSALAGTGLPRDLGTPPLIAVVTQTPTTPDGELLVKQGSLSATWNHEYSGVAEVAVASDEVNGPLIAAVTTSGELLVKQGSLSAAWNHERSGVDRKSVV